jgi:hypothetical protein
MKWSGMEIEEIGTNHIHAIGDTDFGCCVSTTPDVDAELARRARALELARVHVAGVNSQGKYDNLTPTNKLAEELKIARFLLGGHHD